MSAGETNERTLTLPGPFIPLLVGAAALVVCALYGVFQPSSFFRAYLIAFLLWLGVSLGALALVEIGRLTGGAWAAQMRPVLGPAARTLPLLALLFLPVILCVLLQHSRGQSWVFRWADPKTVEGDLELAQKTKYYLNVPGFLIRAVFYFSVWIGSAFLVTKPTPALSPALDTERRRDGVLNGLGLALFGFTVTFASIDWAMSLEPEPRWFSTIYGVMWAVGMILSAFAFGVAFVCRFNPDPDRQVLRDFGNLLLAFTLVWVYVAFSQYLLIWSGNLREEVSWYVRRGLAPWSGMAFVLVLLQFAVPFALLLSGAIKSNPRHLLAVALLVFILRFVDLFWMVAPAFPNNSDLFWLQPLAYLGVGGLWVAYFLWLRPSVTPDPAPAPLPVGELAHE